MYLLIAKTSGIEVDLSDSGLENSVDGVQCTETFLVIGGTTSTTHSSSDRQDP